ncbi:hypothetical protein CYMTET_38367 [Cymbomonas tetramitiformis]|uniref:Uncharacterized protein n=1 Tax=Cymbomonas tetramitiformis TaxID=36881 RepID=A0AAE0CDF4_9CHLO|nr:hypothetical protein CYMTET_38367 [Cymbomonas tetramitiformis]
MGPLESATRRYVAEDATVWNTLINHRTREIAPMVKSVNIDGDTDIGASDEMTRKRKRANAAEGDATASDTKISMTPPLIEMLHIVQQANLIRTGTRSAPQSGRANAPTVDEVIHRQTYAFECLLLTQVTTVRLPDGSRVSSRPCYFGRGCQGMAPGIRGHSEHGGHVLREYLTPREYDIFERTGVSPTERRPCLLCMRSQIQYAHMCLVHNMQETPNSAILLNSYINLRDEADGYDGRYMIPREDTPNFQGLAGSVCVSEKHLLRWYKNTAGVHVIDQSAIKYDGPDGAWVADATDQPF